MRRSSSRRYPGRTASTSDQQHHTRRNSRRSSRGFFFCASPSGSCATCAQKSLAESVHPSTRYSGSWLLIECPGTTSRRSDTINKLLQAAADSCSFNIQALACSRYINPHSTCAFQQDQIQPPSDRRRTRHCKEEIESLNIPEDDFGRKKSWRRIIYVYKCKAVTSQHSVLGPCQESLRTYWLPSLWVLLHIQWETEQRGVYVVSSSA
jgi:hypothetical protein